MAVKRLRGWYLHKEIDNAIHCARGVSSSSSSKAFSPLANKILTLWAHGTLSAVMIRESANLAMLDGAQHPDLYGIAKNRQLWATTWECPQGFDA